MLGMLFFPSSCRAEVILSFRPSLVSARSLFEVIVDDANPDDVLKGLKQRIIKPYFRGIDAPVNRGIDKFLTELAEVSDEYKEKCPVSLAPQAAEGIEAADEPSSPQAAGAPRDSPQAAEPAESSGFMIIAKAEPKAKTPNSFIVTIMPLPAQNTVCARLASKSCWTWSSEYHSVHNRHTKY